MEAKKKTVLIVDDIPENIQVCSNIVSESYSVKAARSGEDALGVLEKFNVDLILLDIMMPEIDGYSLIKYLKSDELTKHIPVIFLTAKAEIEDETYGLSLGASDYITKPISPAIMMARIATHLALSEQQMELHKKNEELLKVNRVLENKLERFCPNVDYEHPKKVKKTPQKPKPLEDYFLNDHKLDLQELIDEIDSNVNMILLRSSFDKQYVYKTGTSMRRYGEILLLYPIFRNLGSGLYSFSNTLLDDDLNPMEDNVNFVLACMESFIFTLTRWHTQVFNKEIKDPNMFDSSMLADLKTMEMALTNSYNAAEEDIEFF